MFCCREKKKKNKLIICVVTAPLGCQEALKQINVSSFTGEVTYSENIALAACSWHNKAELFSRVLSDNYSVIGRKLEVVNSEKQKCRNASSHSVSSQMLTLAASPGYTMCGRMLNERRDPMSCQNDWPTTENNTSASRLGMSDME